MTSCVNQEISVAVIYSAANKRNMPRIVRLASKTLRVREVGFRQNLIEGELIEAHDVVADSGLQLTLLFNVERQCWSIDDGHIAHRDIQI